MYREPYPKNEDCMNIIIIEGWQHCRAHWHFHCSDYDEKCKHYIPLQKR